MSANEFQTMPPLSENAKAMLTKQFDNYLFFEIVKKGVRKYTCTACKKTFERGVAVMQRTTTPQDRMLWHAKHREFNDCPLCGTKSETINIKITKPTKIHTYIHTCVFSANSPDDVWIRCFNHWQEFDDSLKANCGFYEVMRYHLQPGKAESWDRYSNGWHKNKIHHDAFVWNHGTYCEKYDYSFYEDGIPLSATFLKYNGYKYSTTAPCVKYLCWYAIHPQIEMLSKLGHYGLLCQMLYHNSDCKSIIDWSAKKPWELYRMSKATYTAWCNKYYMDMDILKLFHYIKGSTNKDLKLAKRICDFNTNIKNAKKMVRMARQYNTTCKDIMHYCEKVSQNSAGACWQCPGITVREAYQTWLDYLNMAEVIGTNKTISVFPADLKAAHDRLVVSHKYHCEQMTLAELKETAKTKAVSLNKKFPKVDKIYGAIHDKYAYSNDMYSIVVPQNMEDVVLDGLVLDHCTNKADLYYDRISCKESFILFLRKTKTPDKPWYTLEVEPNGPVRQKRSTGDKQYPDLEAAIPFLKEWQKVLSERLTKSDRNLAKKSQQLRKEGYAELKRTKKIIHYGEFAGKLLADVLEADLMEVETA